MVVKKKYSFKETNDVKILVVGPSGCGKTCLLTIFKDEPFPAEYVPTVIDTFATEYQIGEKIIYMMFWDTSGHGGYIQQHNINFDTIDMVLLCYSVQDQANFEQCKKQWFPFARNITPQAHKFVIAMKVDLRNMPDADKDEIVTAEEGLEWSRAINANLFIETSALTGYNVKACFDMMGRYIHEKIFDDNYSGGSGNRFCWCC
ncbi:small GTP-binding protein domain [Edhazardia aedis USNM 41457]|uniref:Small GTP-binding protein domain n=1 Tax=Edhazardia aedis (strain USNM 41457) TaxID=1003232 RepID=J9DRY1_EDHAE|nr:small GTP-binding protein domain [Edhazardia aedis USNM 41457]|eukprot:EJW04047.1 small GTP-binding protein domain [Edhazardia aedis USNM 41457]